MSYKPHKEYTPNWALKAAIAALGLNQREFCRKYRFNENRLSLLVRGKAVVTEAEEDRLTKILGRRFFGKDGRPARRVSREAVA